MLEEYLVYSIRLGGWFNRTGQFTSEVADAKRYPKREAYDLCLLQHSGENPTAIPVSTDTIESITP